MHGVQEGAEEGHQVIMAARGHSCQLRLQWRVGQCSRLLWAGGGATLQRGLRWLDPMGEEGGSRAQGLVVALWGEAREGGAPRCSLGGWTLSQRGEGAPRGGSPLLMGVQGAREGMGAMALQDRWDTLGEGGLLLLGVLLAPQAPLRALQGVCIREQTLRAMPMAPGRAGEDTMVGAQRRTSMGGLGGEGGGAVGLVLVLGRRASVPMRLTATLLGAQPLLGIAPLGD
jgi:hypothetical protein